MKTALPARRPLWSSSSRPARASPWLALVLWGCGGTVAPPPLDPSGLTQVHGCGDVFLSLGDEARTRRLVLRGSGLLANAEREKSARVWMEGFGEGQPFEALYQEGERLSAPECLAPTPGEMPPRIDREYIAYRGSIILVVSPLTPEGHAPTWLWLEDVRFLARDGAERELDTLEAGPLPLLPAGS